MIRLNRLPKRVTDYCYRFKSHFRCGQGRHYLIFCWLVVALIVDTGKGHLKGLSRIVPERLHYWVLLRMVRAGWWDPQRLVAAIAADVLAGMAAPADGRLYLTGDTTLKGKRGKKHPLGYQTRLSEYSRFVFGFSAVLLVACWGRVRVPVAIALMDPKKKGQQNELFRQMLQDFVPPAWARQVIVIADAGYAAKATLRLIMQKQYDYVLALPRTWKLADGTPLRNLARHLPKHLYRRVASYKPDGRRKDYWVFLRRGALPLLGDVTIVLSKQRRNDGPKGVKLFVTNLQRVRATEVLSSYAVRWGVELTIKELKGALHLGQMQVTKDPGRVERSVALSVLAYLLLVHWYTSELKPDAPFSLFQLKQRFTAEVYQEAWRRSEARWRQRLDQYRLAA